MEHRSHRHYTLKVSQDGESVRVIKFNAYH